MRLIIILPMSEIKGLRKPGNKDSFSQQQTMCASPKNNQQQVDFPKISSRLKKSKFIKYRSAFLSSNGQQSRKQKEVNRKKMYTDSKNTDSDHTNFAVAPSKLKLFQKNWKINRGFQQVYGSGSQKRSIEKMKKGHQTLGLYSQLKAFQINPELQNFEQNGTLITETGAHLGNDTEHSAFGSRNLRSHMEINEMINQSNKLIRLIRKEKKNQNFFRSYSEEKARSLERMEEKLGLFSYLKRNFVTNRHELTPQKIEQYFKNPSNKKLEAKISLESRNFLKEKLRNDYRSHGQVSVFRESLANTAITSQIKQKNEKFHEDYRKKYSVPFLSYLSLPPLIKERVIENLTENKKK